MQVFPTYSNRCLFVFYWGFINCKSLQVSRTLLSILADFNSAVIWMVSFLSLIIEFIDSLFLVLRDSSKCSNYDWYYCHFHVIQLFQFSIIIIIINFSHQRELMFFHKSLSNSKSPQVSRTLLSILADFNNAVIWMISARLSISNSSRPLYKSLGIIPSASIGV